MLEPSFSLPFAHSFVHHLIVLIKYLMMLFTTSNSSPSPSRFEPSQYGLPPFRDVFSGPLCPSIDGSIMAQIIIVLLWWFLVQASWFYWNLFSIGRQANSRKKLIFYGFLLSLSWPNQLNFVWFFLRGQVTSKFLCLSFTDFHDFCVFCLFVLSWIELFNKVTRW